MGAAATRAATAGAGAEAGAEQTLRVMACATAAERRELQMRALPAIECVHVLLSTQVGGSGTVEVAPFGPVEAAATATTTTAAATAAAAAAAAAAAWAAPHVAATASSQPVAYSGRRSPSLVRRGCCQRGTLAGTTGRPPLTTWSTQMASCREMTEPFFVRGRGVGAGGREGAAYRAE